MPRVSVIIPAYNCGRYLADSIASVLNQTFKDLELIVVDDGSTDETGVIISPFLNGSKVRCVRNELRKGPSAARNRGIGMAKGEFITFLDADDLMLERRVEEQVRCLEKNKKCDICYTNAIYFNTLTGKEIPCTYEHFSGDIFYYLKRNNFIHPSTVMARSPVFKDNLFDEGLSMHEDWELFLRLARKSARFAFAKEPLTRIRVLENSATDTPAMDAGRRTVGLKARRQWKEFKKDMRLTSVKGLKAIIRYLKFKTGSFLIGFPKRGCFNRPPARRLTQS